VSIILQEMLFGGVTFAVIGFVIGLCIAVMSRDGIFPDVWAGLILAGAGFGVVLGGIAGTVQVIF
jgi:hypothetical protein